MPKLLKVLVAAAITTFVVNSILNRIPVAKRFMNNEG